MRSLSGWFAAGAVLIAVVAAGAGYLIGREEGEGATKTVTISQTVRTAAPPAPQGGLPSAAAVKREAIANAAQANDYDALAKLVDPQFSYTFGEPTSGGPTAYWRQLEQETDERPLQVLRAILEMPYTRDRGVYVWPFAFNKDLKKLTPAERAMLGTIMTPEQLRTMQQFGDYIYWRAGITPDGRWIYFISGD